MCANTDLLKVVADTLSGDSTALCVCVCVGEEEIPANSHIEDGVI